MSAANAIIATITSSTMPSGMEASSDAAASVGAMGGDVSDDILDARRPRVISATASLRCRMSRRDSGGAGSSTLPW